MIKKIVGLLLIIVIFFFAIKALTFLPFFTNLIIGSEQSPFQIGTDYVNQVNKIYPYQNNYVTYSPNTKPDTATVMNTGVIGNVTLEKFEGRLILSVEKANPQTALNIWLINTPQLGNNTEYIDFGVLQKSESVKQYIIDMKGGDISFNLFNNVVVVDNNRQIHAQVILK